MLHDIVDFGVDKVVKWVVENIVEEVLKHG